MSIMDKKAYNEWILHHPVPLFFQPWWLDIVSNNWQVAVSEIDEKSIGIWVYTLEKKIGVSIIRNPLLTPYLGPYLNIDSKLSATKRLQVEEKMVSSLMKALPPWDFIEVLCLPSFNNFFSLHLHGLKNIQRLTYHIDLTQEIEQLFLAIDAKQRSAIRQAERELQLEDAATYIPTFYQYYQQTLQLKGKPYPYSEDLFHNIIHHSLDRKQAFFKAAKNQNGAITAIVFAPYDHQSMYLLLTSTNKDARHNGAVAFLIWQAIVFAKAHGLKIFDFEGSMDGGIEKFFRSFGGNRTSYIQATSNQSKLWKLKELMR